MIQTQHRFRKYKSFVHSETHCYYFIIIYILLLFYTPGSIDPMVKTKKNTNNKFGMARGRNRCAERMSHDGEPH